jgi:hypothetical protein
LPRTMLLDMDLTLRDEARLAPPPLFATPVPTRPAGIADAVSRGNLRFFVRHPVARPCRAPPTR